MSGALHIWSVTPGVVAALHEISERLAPLDRTSDEAQALQDDIRALPGHPRDTDETSCVIYVTPDMSHHDLQKLIKQALAAGYRAPRSH